MISPTDKVLVAFSGGPSSRVALQFVHDMQERAQRNFDASRDRSLPVFGVGVVFINESTVLPIPSNEMEEAVGVVSEVVSSLATPRKELRIVPIDTAYSSDSDDGKERIAKVVIRREGRMCCSVCECWHCKRLLLNLGITGSFWGHAFRGLLAMSFQPL
ncbi:hypothetical protein JHK86_053410 [Glycine max]|nr:hypothetical protein JHK86_053410 [Glycine max]